jgi:hypothetical protein
MKYLKRDFILVAVFFCCLTAAFPPSQAATIDGELGLFHVPYATTLGKSKLLVNGQAANTVSHGTYWYYAAISQAGAIYGMNQWWDMWITYRGYQDNPLTEYEGWGNLKIGNKYNFYNNRKLRYNLAGELITIIPTGRWANVAWEPFMSGEVEFQLNIVGSYQKYYHGVFGYIFHNDAGIAFTKYEDAGNQPEPATGAPATHELVFGLGGEYPVLKDILVASGELTGRFVLNPKQYTISSEPWMVLTLGAKYFLSDILYLSGGMDLRLTGGTNDNTVFDISRKGPGFYTDCANYPFWKIRFDVNWMAYQKYRVIQKPGEKEKAKKEEQLDEEFIDLINDFGSVEVSAELQEKMKLYKQLKMQQKETKEAEQELEEVRVKRKEAEKELSRLRQLLEEIE